MKLFIWKIVWKIVCKWQVDALHYDLWEQFKDCEEILCRMRNYARAMIEAGVWEVD